MERPGSPLVLAQAALQLVAGIGGALAGALSFFADDLDNLGLGEESLSIPLCALPACAGRILHIRNKSHPEVHLKLLSLLQIDTEARHTLLYRRVQTGVSSGDPLGFDFRWQTNTGHKQGVLAPKKGIPPEKPIAWRVPGQSAED